MSPKFRIGLAVAPPAQTLAAPDLLVFIALTAEETRRDRHDERHDGVAQHVAAQGPGHEWGSPIAGIDEAAYVLPVLLAAKAFHGHHIESGTVGYQPGDVIRCFYGMEGFHLDRTLSARWWSMTCHSGIRHRIECRIGSDCVTAVLIVSRFFSLSIPLASCFCAYLLQK
ncbi:MAG: hypothetical protein NDI91_09195 [Sulfuritalea sp.]|nr:hypothetical protein [Sulfuritalea sp.]